MKIYDTLTKQKRDFVPIEPYKVKIYVCGQTVYDFCHLGHARKEIVFDMIRRWFISSGYEVTFVENITDIEDKIIKRANEKNISIQELTKEYIEYMHEDFTKLGILKPDYEPKATEYIDKMIEIISNLMANGYAYQANNGDVYYAVRKFENYGLLSGKNIEQLMAGERVELDKNKQDPLDFVLWKAAKEHEPSWPAPFGNGRPGWHIECSAMSESILGKNFDIHGGGQDLQFPHHENEIAQSEAHNQCKFANYWIHNGFLNIEDEKMSKSTGNFYTLRDILQMYDAEVIRYFMIKTHYRSPLNFKFSLLDEAKNELVKFYNVKEMAENSQNKEVDLDNKYVERFRMAMNDDFNTPLALSVLFELMREINVSKDMNLALVFCYLASTLGILQQTAEHFLRTSLGGKVDAQQIEQLIHERTLAKEAKNYQLADQIRNQLKEMGVVIEDTAANTKWRLM